MNTMLTRLHRYWLVRGRNVIIPLAVERRFWRLVWAARDPKLALADWRKRRSVPAIGQQVLAHGEPKTVTGYRDGDPDGLVFDDGSSCSWFFCCDPIEQP